MITVPAYSVEAKAFKYQSKITFKLNCVKEEILAECTITAKSSQNLPRLFQTLAKPIQTKSRPGGALRRLGNVPGHLEPSWGDLGYYRKILPKSSNPNAAATRGGAGAKSDQHLPIIHPLDASRLRLRDVLEVYWMRLGMRLEKILGRLETNKKN